MGWTWFSVELAEFGLEPGAVRCPGAETPSKKPGGTALVVFFFLLTYAFQIWRLIYWSLVETCHLSFYWQLRNPKVTYSAGWIKAKIYVWHSDISGEKGSCTIVPGFAMPHIPRSQLSIMLTCPLHARKPIICALYRRYHCVWLHNRV